ncbi:MAG: hypothetical protein JOZ93_15135 [Sinobacteraceae bacterium]|nr:hypothetical protein [Nevskiaceae bacterium]MBV9913913.1 hypothetical protein [Nevskiaceae bacterium]
MKRLATVLDRPGRLWLLALLLLLIAIVLPPVPVRHSAFDDIVVFDITQSMDVEDYELGRHPVSRLQYARAAARDALRQLPCGSRIGWAAFTGYRTLLLLAPVEVCANYADLLRSLGNVNGEMRWENASEITKGVYWAMRGAKQLASRPNVVFISDGQEAPPLDPRYPLPMFEDLRPGQVHGWLLGAGGATPQRIPKSDDDGNRVGYWQPDEVIQRPETTAGSARPPEEHLSALDATHLQELAHQVGFDFARLDQPSALLRAVRDPRFARRELVRMDLSWIPASMALLLLAWQFRAGAVRSDGSAATARGRAAGVGLPT